MITEDYVSFETAKLLKKKGFDMSCEYFGYNIFDSDHRQDTIENFSRSEAPHLYVPTISQARAMKWLREVHNQIIVPGIRVNNRTSGIINCYFVGIWYIPKNNGGAFCYISPTPENGYSSYEEACEAAIKYCLEILI